MEILLYAAGVIIMTIAIALSIALHEVGHLVPAKLFKVRVPQYMIGFGKTIFSFRRGETEYGFKAIPLGGYISMIGMYPPAPEHAERAKRAMEHPAEGNAEGTTGVEEEHEPEIETLRAGTTSPFGSLANAAREADLERLKPGDENRLFYKLPVYKRMIIMLGGPSMNLLIGIVCTAILICGFGTLSATNKVASVSDCVPKATITEDRISYSECTDSSAPSPAKAAGLRKDDRIVAINGNRTSTWEQVSSNIRQAGNNTVTVTIERDGSEQQLTMTPALLERPVVDEKTREYVRNDDGSFKMMTGGFIGISPTSEMVPGSLGDVMPNVGDTLGRIAHSMWSLPQRVWELGVNLFSNQERDENSPVSVVGVSRIAGEVASTDRIDLKAKTATLVSLIAGMNLMLFAFNLLPLLPLDGGHVFGALWEAIRRGFAKLTRRADPGPFDPVKLLPLTYVVAGAFILMSIVIIAADFIKPLRLF